MRILKLLAGIIFSFLCFNPTISQDFDPEFTKALEYYENGQNRLAALEFESAIPYVEMENGLNDTTLLTQLLILTGVCYELDLQYYKAEHYYLRVKSIFENINATKDYGYGVSLNNLGQLYDGLGRYREAEKLYLQAINIDKEAIGEDNFEFANNLSNLAALYYTMGRYEQAIPLYIEALDILTIVIGKNHPRYALTLNNLAILYVALKSFDQADSLFKETLEIAISHLGENHPQYAIYLSNYGQMYYEMGQYDQAESLYVQSLKIAEDNLGENHPSVAIKLNNLGSLYVKMSHYDEAEPLFTQALDINKKLLGTNHPEYAKTLNNLAEVYQKKGNTKQVEIYLKQAFQVYQYQIKMNTGFLSEYELEQFLNTFNYHLDNYQSFNYMQSQSNPSVGTFAFDIELIRKGILLRSALGIKTSILESGDSSIIDTYSDLYSLRKKINKLQLKPIDERTEDIIQLKKQENELEKALALKSRDYRIAQEENEIIWKEIKKNLKPGEASIEFSSFRYYNGDKSTDSILYCAVLLRKQDTVPKLVYLFEESELKKAIPTSGATNRDINYLYQSQDLYNLIWKPIDGLLKGIKNIYYAPSGLLHSVSMSVLSCPDNKVLIEKYNLIQVGTTRSLALQKEPISRIDATVYGGIIYDTDTATIISKSERYVTRENDLLAYNRAISTSNRSGFKYLPGTMEEAKLISEKLENKNINTTLLTGTDALEESFHVLSGSNSPSIIHLSTHGYYFPDTISGKNIKYSTSGEMLFRNADDPLLRSGLLMAGANNAWEGLQLPIRVEDGILTAREVSNMNLMNTELVVLSACQTGQGDVKGSEGVEGLQRGFKMAGVRYIIMSLWQVPDKETTEFMETFYDSWLGGEDIYEAFRTTQITMRNKYKDDPFKWAGFVFVE